MKRRILFANVLTALVATPFLGAALRSSTDPMNALSAEALQLGQETAFSAEEAARGMREMVSAGVPLGYMAFNAEAQPIQKALSGWLLCDGSNGTPDLRGRLA